MKVLSETQVYRDLDRTVSLGKSLSNGVEAKLYVQINSEKFIDFQKEIFEDFFGNFLQEVEQTDLIDSQKLEKLGEEALGLLNQDLLTFADKLHDLPPFDIRGYFQLVLDWQIKIWLIGNSSLLIFRDEKLYYSLMNSCDPEAAIDTFSEFVGGETQTGDLYLYGGLRFADVLDETDISEMEGLLAEMGHKELVNALSEVLSTRIDKQEIWFLSWSTFSGLEVNDLRLSPKKKLMHFAQNFTASYLKKLSWKVNLEGFKNKAQSYSFSNQSLLVAGFLWIAVLVMLYTIISQFSSSNWEITLSTWSGTMQTVSLAQLKKDISAFAAFDASSDEKSLKYQEIINTFKQIEAQGIWQEDLKNLKILLDASYEQGYNVKRITSFEQFDDPAVGKKTEILTLTGDDFVKLGSPISIAVGASTNVAGSKWALMGVVNAQSKWTLVSYNGATDAKSCSLSVSKKGLICYTEDGNLFYVAKTGVESVETTDGAWATSDIGGTVSFNKNLYLFQKSPKNFASVLLTKYTNIAGSESQYKNWQNYTLLAGSGAQLPDQMQGFVVDQTFLWWGGGKLYQFWRPDNAATALDYREVPMQWGDKVVETYSNNVKVLASASSPYVIFFDKDKQTLTTYVSTPVKTNQNHTKNFKLAYLFRFKFDLAKMGDSLVDVAIPDATNENPELYALTQKALYKINLYEYIKAIESHQTITTQ